MTLSLYPVIWSTACYMPINTNSLLPTNNSHESWPLKSYVMRVVHIAGNTTIEVDLSQMCPDLTYHPQMVNNDISSQWNPKRSPLNHEKIRWFFLYAHNRKSVCCLAPGYQMSIKKLCGDLTNQGVKQVSISSEASNNGLWFYCSYYIVN